MRNHSTMARGAVVLVVLACTALGAIGTGASAQLLEPSPTTTTSASSGSTSTTAPQPKLVGGGGDDPGRTKGVIPPEYAKIIASVKRSRANNTKALLAALQPLVDSGRMNIAQAATYGFGRFPVGGVATFTDDWLNPRFTPVFHLHEGTDIFAPTGTPVRSPVDGVMRHTSGGAGGIAAYVRTVEGHDVYFAHLASYSELKPGPVKVGDVIGFVGDTGNAKGGAPHLHFELHPRGRGPVNPKPYLDQWIAQALQSAPDLVASYLGATTAVTAPAVSEVLPTAVKKIQPPRAQLAWASSANPTGGALRLAEVEAAVASLRVDWSQRARAAEADRKVRAQADRAAKAMLRPLTPRGLLDVLDLR